MYVKVFGVCGLLLGGLLLGGCCLCPPTPVSPSCIDFEDQAVGDQFNVGDSFIASGITIDVVAVGVYDDRAEITGGPYTTASGNDLRPLNVGVKFNLPASSFDVAMNFADLGGRSQFLINGAAVSTPSVNRVIEFDGATIGGVLVTVAAIRQGNNWYGDVSLSGSINTLTVVGQELWLDDVCYMQ